jgi:hypothetical protein
VQEPSEADEQRMWAEEGRIAAELEAFVSHGSRDEAGAKPCAFLGPRRVAMMSEVTAHRRPGCGLLQATWSAEEARSPRTGMEWSREGGSLLERPTFSRHTRPTAMKKLRIAILRFGTARQETVLE